jgi:hypothetical protein
LLTRRSKSVFVAKSTTSPRGLAEVRIGLICTLVACMSHAPVLRSGLPAKLRLGSFLSMSTGLLLFGTEASGAELVVRLQPPFPI